MTEQTFLMHDAFKEPLTKEDFFCKKEEYLNYIENSQHSLISSSNIYNLINLVKREHYTIGPYKNISLFEALNRIGSDLVLLNGAERLFNGEIKGILPDKIKLQMGSNRGFDFEVYAQDKIIYGEAFNAAESFCKEKMRQAIHKLADKCKKDNLQTALIMVNDDVKTVLENYNNEREIEMKDKTKFIKIYCSTIK